MANSASWNTIFDVYNIHDHDFDLEPFKISAKQITSACQDYKKVNEKEARILTKQDSREARPEIFIKKNLFVLPTKNGEYIIIKGDGYFDIPPILSETKTYDTKIDFELTSSKIGNSEMQHLDFAYASSLIRTFMNDDTLVLTIRGRKYTPEFNFNFGKHNINVKSVQTEIDAGYEGRNKIVLIEAKNSTTNNTIIRQLFYPYKQWKIHTNKEVFLLFFEKRKDIYKTWQYGFMDEMDYKSIYLVKSEQYYIK